jgi:glycosyltransferase involved in cell wall biosynthesis
VLKEAADADLLFISDYGLPPTIANFFLRKPTLIKIVGDWAWEHSRLHHLVTETIDEFQTRHHRTRIEVLKKIQRFYVSRCKRVLTPSRYLKGIISGWGIEPDKITVVHNAVQPELYEIPPTQEDARRAIPIPRDGRIVLTVGRIVSWKGMERVIQACALLPSDVKLMIVGEGPHQPVLEEEARRHGMNSRCIFTGPVPHRKVTTYMKAADVLALATEYEGLSHVLLESLMVGLPAVTTRIGGNPETIRDGKEGLLYELKDTDGLRVALSKLLENKELRDEMSTNARERSRYFSWNRMIDGTLELMQETLRTGTFRPGSSLGLEALEK